MLMHTYDYQTMYSSMDEIKDVRSELLDSIDDISDIKDEILSFMECEQISELKLVISEIIVQLESEEFILTFEKTNLLFVLRDLILLIETEYENDC